MAQLHLIASAEGLGFDPQWVTHVAEQWGDSALTMIVEAGRHGFSASCISDITDKFGPKMLDLLVTTSNKMRLAGMTGDINPGQANDVNSIVIDVLIQQWLPVIIQKYLPVILENYSQQQIAQFLIGAVLAKISK